MNGSTQLRTPEDFNSRANSYVIAGFSLLATIALACVLAQQLAGLQIPGKQGLSEAVLVVAALLATIAAAARTLPLPNVLLGAFIIATVGTTAHALGAKYGLPFGPVYFTERGGPRILGVNWAVPVLWVIVVFNSRGVARLMLRPWRKLRVYGFWLIGITMLLAALLDAALEPVASRINLYWTWQPTKLPFSLHGVPVSNFLGWLLTAGLALAFASPMLINKRQRQQKSVWRFHPLFVWLLGMAATGTIAGKHGLWAAALFATVCGVATAIFAIRGATW